ncbi:hypothetical protein POM88_035552 [Heracleum sosnowskyi]|uniref:Uncharacterized protein n=1 Tax=Heracleum sosnowskyi TaxID=360622 RepID=A0AAD8HNQ3_9APIA|nr:hypothetical protein POM88_035552 [Heracleum sosnowskyi]
MFRRFRFKLKGSIRGCKFGFKVKPVGLRLLKEYLRACMGLHKLQINQVAKYLVPTIRSIPANGSTKPTCIHLLIGIKAYSKIFWLMDQQYLFTFIFFLLLMSKKMMCI